MTDPLSCSRSQEAGPQQDMGSADKLDQTLETNECMTATHADSLYVYTWQYRLSLLVRFFISFDSNVIVFLWRAFSTKV